MRGQEISSEKHDSSEVKKRMIALTGVCVPGRLPCGIPQEDPLPSGFRSAIGELLGRLEAGRHPEYLSARLHEADCVLWLKVTNHLKQPLLRESLMLGFVNNSVLPPCR